MWTLSLNQCYSTVKRQNLHNLCDCSTVSEELWCISSKCLRLLKAKAKSIWDVGSITIVSCVIRQPLRKKMENWLRKTGANPWANPSWKRLMAHSVGLWRLSLHTWGRSPALWVSRVRGNERKREKCLESVEGEENAFKLALFELLLTLHSKWLPFYCLNG